MIEAEQSLMKVITELDNGMRTQFTVKFDSAADVVQLNLWKMKIYLKQEL